MLLSTARRERPLGLDRCFVMSLELQDPVSLGVARLPMLDEMANESKSNEKSDTMASPTTYKSNTYGWSTITGATLKGSGLNLCQVQGGSTEEFRLASDGSKEQNVRVLLTHESYLGQSNSIRTRNQDHDQAFINDNGYMQDFFVVRYKAIRNLKPSAAVRQFFRGKGGVMRNTWSSSEYTCSVSIETNCKAFDWVNGATFVGRTVEEPTATSGAITQMDIYRLSYVQT